MKRIKLYSIYTDEVVKLKNIFIESIKDDWDIDIQYWGKSGDSDFSTKAWYDILKKKLEFLIIKIKENWGQVIIWSDIDIQFFSKGNDLIEAAIADKDILFQSERWPVNDVNTGFVVIKCNEKTLQLYQLAADCNIEHLELGDQSAINTILRKKKIEISWSILPPQFWATSHFMYNSSLPPIDIVLHHANYTAPITINGKKIRSLELKLKHMKHIREYVQNAVNYKTPTE